MEDGIASSLLSCEPILTRNLPVGRYNLVLTLGFRPWPDPGFPRMPSVPTHLSLDEKVTMGHRSRNA